VPAALEQLRQSIRESLGVPRRRRAKRKRDAIRRAGRNATQVWEVLAGMLLRYGGASSGNCIDVYCDGDETFESIWQTMDGAQKRVWCETYILEPDRVGTRTIETLAAAAKRGCQVRLLYDAVGSPRITEAFLKPLRDAGGDITRFNPIWTWKRRYSLLSRDHRKIIIIDNHTAFAGGRNISEDYAARRHGNSLFHDCHARLQGPCVRDLANVFLASWRVMRDDVERVDRVPRCSRKSATFAQVLASRGLLGRRTIQRAMRLTIRHAVGHCLITNPYFVPPQRIMTAIVRAAKRGVDVRILTSGQSDVPMVRRASQHIYGRFLKHGVRIYELYGTTLHAKTMTIDGLYSTIGSFNLDYWSYNRNLEVNVGMIDPAVAEVLEANFESDLQNATEVTLENWKKRTRWQRFLHWCAYQLMRL
jgi:cardiolipin synthase